MTRKLSLLWKNAVKKDKLLSTACARIYVLLFRWLNAMTNLLLVTKNISRNPKTTNSQNNLAKSSYAINHFSEKNRKSVKQFCQKLKNALMVVRSNVKTVNMKLHPERGRILSMIS